MYKITFSYWDRYFHFDGGLSRFECRFFRFLKKTRQGLMTQVAIHRYSINEGAGQIGRHVWSKTYNKEAYYGTIDDIPQRYLKDVPQKKWQKKYVILLCIFYIVLVFPLLIMMIKNNWDAWCWFWQRILTW